MIKSGFRATLPNFQVFVHRSAFFLSSFGSRIEVLKDLVQRIAVAVTHRGHRGQHQRIEGVGALAVAPHVLPGRQARDAAAAIAAWWLKRCFNTWDLYI